ncbi:hypothetical protein SRHO_G00223900 [Serrasalmus rhombeus]
MRHVEKRREGEGDGRRETSTLCDLLSAEDISKKRTLLVSTLSAVPLWVSRATRADPSVQSSRRSVAFRVNELFQHHGQRLDRPVLSPRALIGSERTAELKPRLTRLGDRLASVFGFDRSFEKDRENRWNPAGMTRPRLQRAEEQSR